MCVGCGAWAGTNLRTARASKDRLSSEYLTSTSTRSRYSTTKRRPFSDSRMSDLHLRKGGEGVGGECGRGVCEGTTIGASDYRARGAGAHVGYLT